MAKHVQYETPTLLVEAITVVIAALLSLEGLQAPTVVTKPRLEPKASLMLSSNMHVDKSKRNRVKGVLGLSEDRGIPCSCCKLRKCRLLR
ncbi:hypothetical protein VNO77_04220 [Canavalia gladiata]|uniref:Uncharacterized protein n=1 Tax=Canavalia gladiata TaxID=3824 RepID=A0AAN9R8V1_CANGL